MNDEALLRYSRHILLPQVDLEGQQRISQARIMVVGLGGLGSPVAMYLAAAGVGQLILVDDDKVELSNLQRQIIHSEADIGSYKVDSASAAIGRLNSSVSVLSYAQRFDETVMRQALTGLTSLVDCTDSFSSRDALNRSCLNHKIPLVSAAAIGFEAQICSFDFRRPDSPCYRCLYSAIDDTELACSQSGVFSPLLGVAGSMQALEALKLACGLEPSMAGRLSLFDGLKGQWQSLAIGKNKACSVCAEQKKAG